MIELLKYIILGIIQGLTEPLPISSSGHLIVFRNMFNTNMFNDFNFEIVVNFGSFLAILFIFRKDIIKLIKSFFTFLLKKEQRKDIPTKIDFKYCLLIIIATIPVSIVGLIFKSFIEDKIGNNVKLVGFALLITALALFVVSRLKGKKEDKDITYLDAILIGLLQVFTIVPGISRSGTVLVACLLRDFKRDTALKYTFMLYFPISIAAMILGIKDIINMGNLNTVLIPYFIGMVATTIVTYFSYRWMSEWVKKGKLWYFAIYCIIAGITVLFFFR